MAKLKICEHCGNEYRGHPNSKYCSDDCKINHAKNDSNSQYVAKIKYSSKQKIKNTKKKNGKNEYKVSKTICWTCENACGKCSWSASFTPVEGWEVEHTIRKRAVDGKSIETGGYTVLSCPQYEPDARHRNQNIK